MTHEQPHDEAIRLVESTDIAATGFAGNLESHHTIEGAYEVANYIGSITRPRTLKCRSPSYRSFNSTGRTALPNAALLSTKVVIGS